MAERKTGEECANFDLKQKMVSSIEETARATSQIVLLELRTCGITTEEGEQKTVLQFGGETEFRVRLLIEEAVKAATEIVLAEYDGFAEVKCEALRLQISEYVRQIELLKAQLESRRCKLVPVQRHQILAQSVPNHRELQTSTIGADGDQEAEATLAAIHHSLPTSWENKGLRVGRPLKGMKRLVVALERLDHHSERDTPDKELQQEAAPQQDPSPNVNDVTPAPLSYSGIPENATLPDIELRDVPAEVDLCLFRISETRPDRYALLLFQRLITDERYRDWAMRVNWGGFRGKWGLPNNLKKFILDRVSQKFHVLRVADRRNVKNRINEYLRKPSHRMTSRYHL
ncbi:uncharacterized protein LOC120536830 isoform X2 [Polypterus senegalus]|uniref:uncharacterized protein LOC120536830 isoform X2 n=1 Tax=Polypterus senegalus TaxID=55291 RepID=UPI00196404EE|nr:uncharacterized protein LOC120536830 isoform X2 [Polypterus senegalus]